MHVHMGSTDSIFIHLMQTHSGYCAYLRKHISKPKQPKPLQKQSKQLGAF